MGESDVAMEAYYDALGEADAEVARLEGEKAALAAALREHGGFHAPKDCKDKHLPLRPSLVGTGTTCIYCEPALSDTGEGWLPPEVGERAWADLRWCIRGLEDAANARPEHLVDWVANLNLERLDHARAALVALEVT